MSSFSCKVYGDLSKMTDTGLEHAWNSTVIRMGWSPDNAAFQGVYSYEDYKEAMAMLICETEYRWENGGKQAFNECIQRTFGRPACN